jgi:hypothetical protein
MSSSKGRKLICNYNYGSACDADVDVETTEASEADEE